MRTAKRYAPQAVWDYMDTLGEVDMDIIDGCLIDTYIIYHGCGIIEVFEETALNEWSSAYVRHIYRKGLPKKFITELERMEA